MLSLLRRQCQALYKLKARGSGLVTLGIEKRKAKCGEWRLSWHVTESIMLRLPCAALIAEGKPAPPFITAPTGRATGPASCGGPAPSGGGARRAAGRPPS